MKLKRFFESQEYPYSDSAKSQFFNPTDSQLYEIRDNTIEEKAKFKCTHSLWNASKDKRISGLYISAQNPTRFNFDYLGEAYLLEITPDSLIIQFLFIKGLSENQSPISKKENNKGKPKYRNPGKTINWGGLW
jgi:hypothetical protein